MSELNLWMNYSFKNIFNLAPRMWSFSKKIGKENAEGYSLFL